MSYNNEPKPIKFDQVFAIWLNNEVEDVDQLHYLPVANSKGFNSISEWRLTTAIRQGLDTKKWSLEKIESPEEVIPKIIVGPYQGWSLFFENKLTTNYEQALEIPEFFNWVESHDRIPDIAKHFPTTSTIILLRKENGDLIHIEGGHRICAFTYAKKIAKPVQAQFTAAIANVSDDEIEKLIEFLHQGTDKQ